MARLKLILTGFAVSAVIATGGVVAKDWGKYKVENRRSGYTYMTDQTRLIQNDDFDNPGMLWVERGEGLWHEVDGKEGKSCQSCHRDAGESMKKVGATYPVYAPEMSKMINVEQRINQCKTDRMGAKPFKWESEELLSITTFVRHQARDEPIQLKVDGPAKPFYDKGKAFYEERRGQLDMACMHCHQNYPGGQIRANILSQGQSNGFPTYRLKWQQVGSLHRRFRGCNKQVRAQPFAYGADEYVNLELYVGSRGQGLPVETPAVRN